MGPQFGKSWETLELYILFVFFFLSKYLNQTTERNKSTEEHYGKSTEQQ